MKCTCCGYELDNTIRYCPKCAQNNPNYIAPIKKDDNDEYKNNIGKNNYNNSNVQTQHYDNSTNSYKQNPRVVYVHDESKAIAILALIFSILGGWLGLLFSIIGLCTYKEKENKNLCLAALIIFCVEIFIAIIVVAIMIAMI